MSREEIPQFKTLEEEKAYWESKGPLGIEAQRDEIREGIANMITSALKLKDEDIPGFESQVACNIIAFLNEQGVVRKVNVPQITGESAKMRYYEELIDG